VSTPSKIADSIFENFIKSKKNLFSRVSSKIIDTVKKEDKIEDFIQELERTGVWMLGRREVCISPFNLHIVLFLWYGFIDCSL
jgi:homogentisate solanesyltransferase